MKVFERMLEYKVRQQVKIDDVQFGNKGCGINDVIFSQTVQGKCQEKTFDKYSGVKKCITRTLSNAGD